MRESNPKKQGDKGLGIAIGYYAAKGYTVSIPLTDSQSYDLIVEIEHVLQRVQVKTATFQRNGKYECNLKVCGGNRSAGNIIKRFDATTVDVIFVVTEEMTMYHIPSDKTNSTTILVLGPKYQEYIVK